jgi:acyl-CoA reductase-like NAD-dependent aldehyde dehydrogenase
VRSDVVTAVPPFHVQPDADVAAAAKGIVGSAFANTGQLCCAAKRIFVHESLVDSFKAEAVKAGDSSPTPSTFFH